MKFKFTLPILFSLASLTIAKPLPVPPRRPMGKIPGTSNLPVMVMGVPSVCPEEPWVCDNICKQLGFAGGVCR